MTHCRQSVAWLSSSTRSARLPHRAQRNRDSTVAKVAPAGRRGTGTALVGGAAGVVRSAKASNTLGIFADLLEVAATVTGGLVSTQSLADDPSLAKVTATVFPARCLSERAHGYACAVSAGRLAGTVGWLTFLPTVLDRIRQTVTLAC